MLHCINIKLRRLTAKKYDVMNIFARLITIHIPFMYRDDKTRIILKVLGRFPIYWTQSSFSWLRLSYKDKDSIS